MDPRLIHRYASELRHLKDSADEFAREFPAHAGRLGIHRGGEVDDPWVERLLEGFAFLAARIQLKLDDEQPALIAHLLEALYPNFLAPVPAMMVVRLDVDPHNPNLARGPRLSRGSEIVSSAARGQDTHCEFRTAHEVQLWPLEIVQVRAWAGGGDLPAGRRAAGAVAVRLRCGGGLQWRQLPIERLALHVSAPESFAYRLHEALTTAATGTLVRTPRGGGVWRGADSVRPTGFAADEALLPESLRAFSGHRLLQELAAMPQRFLGLEIGELLPRVAAVAGDELEIVLPLSRFDPEFEALVDRESLSLHCTPAINLFHKSLDRVRLDDGRWEHLLVPDGTRPMDFEVHSVDTVTGFGSGRVARQTFRPLHAAAHGALPGAERRGEGEGEGGYTLRREARRRPGTSERSAYEGEEVWITVVDPRHAPYDPQLRHLAVTAWVTNRHLPMQLPPPSPGQAAWELASPGAVREVHVLTGPTRPVSRRPVGAAGWQLVSHLSLNHLSLTGATPQEAAAQLRTLLALYAPPNDPAWDRQVQGVLGLAVAPVVRRLPFGGPLTFGSGLGIELELDDSAFQGTSAVLFASVLQRWLTRHAAINTFVELRLRTPDRGRVHRWAPMAGGRELV